jgi:uncharacterized protein YlxP (DUF503 family)
VTRVRGRDAEERIFVGVLRAVVEVPGSVTLKDRRQGVASVRDRIARRFAVSIHEVGADDPVRQTLVVTTAGNDPAQVRSTLDACARMVREHPMVVPNRVDVDVFRWRPSEEDWAARMMAELGEGGE